MTPITTPGTCTGTCQAFCDELQAEVRRWEDRWQQLKADLEDAQRQGYQVDALSFMRGVEQREVTS